MSFTEYLKINGELLPFPDSYDLSLSSVESDSGGETEAGTIQRDVVRHGVVDISVSFTVTAVWLKKLTAYSKKNKLTVQYFDTDTLSLKETEMYIDGFKAKLEKDTSYKGIMVCQLFAERILGGAAIVSCIRQIHTSHSEQQPQLLLDW